MAEKLFEITGVDQLQKALRTKIRPSCKNIMGELMEDLRRCSSGFAPIDTGHLAQSGRVVVRETKQQVVGEVIYETTADEYDYALRMHEGVYTPRKQNTGGKSKFGSVSWRTGSKFLSEPMRQLLPSYINHVAKSIHEDLNK